MANNNLPFVAAITVLFVHFSMFPATVSVTPPNIITDKHALLALKAHITHDPYNLLTNNWSVSTDVCNWIGVTCGSRHHRVTALNISNMALIGTIPPELGNMSFLSVLDLKHNGFHTSLPDELAQLHRLKDINFNFNNFHIAIPSWLGSLSKLHSFSLFNNSFIGSIPPSLGNMSSLQGLDLGLNQLSGVIPKQIGNLTKLKVLSLAGNKLEGVIPPEFGNLTKLKELYLGTNNLRGEIPEGASNLANLEILNLADNMLTGGLPVNMCHQHPPVLQELVLFSNQLTVSILNSLSQCTELRMVSLSSNNFTGVIPKEIGNLIKLKDLYLNYNELQGSIPQELGHLVELEQLHLGNNKLSGVISPEFGNLTKLKKLYLGTNNLRGHIPYELGNLPNLEFLILRENHLTGTVPGTIFNISTLIALDLSRNKLHGSLPANLNPNLEELYLSNNNFSGSITQLITNASKLYILTLVNNSLTGFIPETIGDLRNLKRLQLQYNHLTSSNSDLTFLSSLTKCKNLESLSLSSNPLNGILPSSLGNLSSSLTDLFMTDCNINGKIPWEIGHLKNLMRLSLAINGLSGPIPVSLGWLQELQGLNLHDNKLEGSIPNELCRLDKLSELYLQDNKLFGSIPTCLGDLSSLRKLSLSSNRLNSSIPLSLWNLIDILELNLSSNFITGPLSSKIQKLKVATKIDLSMNQLSGNIPSIIGSLISVQVLSLKYNKLQGPIPTEVGDMISLEFLDLSNNDLFGEIPKSMERLKHLHFLNLSFNELDGEIPTGEVFTDLTVESFIGNLHLCDSLGKRGPPCKNHPHKKTKITTILLSIILPLGVILGLTFILIRCLKRRKKLSHDTEMSTLATWRRISFDELMLATNEFNESNLLGSGSFGSVYRGRLRDGIEIAIKVFNIQLEIGIKSFDVECEVMRNIRHRNLIKIISSCSNADFKALIMEYMPNGNLDKYLYSHNYFLDVLQRLNIMIDVASALEYLHFDYSIIIVHCDLKPSNILLDEHMIAHLSDFGIAKLLGDGTSMTQTQILATIGYMAPEYGRGGKVSRKSDVYSYGILLMETFTRKKPTDDFFTEEMSLKRWVSDSLKNSITEVVDAHLLSIEDERFVAKEECMLSILSLALDCTHELPVMRVDMKYVVSKLIKIKELFLAKIGRDCHG